MIQVMMLIMLVMMTDSFKHHQLKTFMAHIKTHHTNTRSYKYLSTNGAKRYLAWRNARTVSNFFYTSHMVCDYFDTLMQDLNKVSFYQNKKDKEHLSKLWKTLVGA